MPKVDAVTPSAAGAVAATGTAARSTAPKRQAAPPPPKPEDFEFQPSTPEVEPAPMVSPADSTSQLAREKRAALLAARPAAGPVRQVAEQAGTAALLASAAVPGASIIPAYATAYKAYAASPEVGTYAVGKLASAARSAQEKLGTDLGLTRVTQLAREYLPQSREAEYQMESPRPGSRMAQSGRERIYVPSGAISPSERSLSSVAEFRKFYETEAANLAETRRKLEEKDAEIFSAPDTATEADMKKLAKERSTLKQLETDSRASLMRAGFNDAEINALTQEVPAAR